MTELALAGAVYSNYCEMWRSVGALAPDDGVFQVEQRDDMLLIRSLFVQRVPHMVLAPAVDSTAARKWTARLVHEVSHEPVSVMVGMPPGLEHGSLADALQAEGFMRGARPSVAMARLEQHGTPHWHDDAITLATNERDLDEARTLLARIFGLPATIFAFYTPPSIVRTFLLQHRGEPVGAACLCPFAGSAGIYSVGVLPSMRGQGFAQRLVRHLLADAAQDGYSLAVLSCEPNLIPLYQRLGFKVCWELVTYWLEAWWR